MTAIRAQHAGDPRVSPALSSHLERHRHDRGNLAPGALVPLAGVRPALHGVRRAAAVVLDWPTRSQRRAVRNAMLASTALVERRIERDEVEQFLVDFEVAPTADQI